MRDVNRTNSRIEPDEVGQASLDSFPASDPPPWSGLRLGPPAPETPREGNRVRETGNEPSTRSDESRVEPNR